MDSKSSSISISLQNCTLLLGKRHKNLVTSFLFVAQMTKIHFRKVCNGDESMNLCTRFPVKILAFLWSSQTTLNQMISSKEHQVTAGLCVPWHLQLSDLNWWRTYSLLKKRTKKVSIALNSARMEIGKRSLSMTISLAIPLVALYSVVHTVMKCGSFSQKKLMQSCTVTIGL